MSSNELTDATWRKSSYSGNTGNCVEVGTCLGGVMVRDTKDPEGGRLMISPDSWRSFIQEAGE